VLARRERLLHLLVVEVVRRRQVDDVDSLVGEERLVALVRGSQPLGSGPLLRRADHARHLDAEPTQRVDVDDADEAGPDDPRPELADLPPRHSHESFCPIRRSRSSGCGGEARVAGLAIQPR
jgi:hypothetical protein